MAENVNGVLESVNGKVAVTVEADFATSVNANFPFPVSFTLSVSP